MSDTHAVSVASVRHAAVAGYQASCSCGWRGDVRGRDADGPRFICPAPDDRGRAMRDAVDHQKAMASC